MRTHRPPRRIARASDARRVAAASAERLEPRMLLTALTPSGGEFVASTTAGNTHVAGAVDMDAAGNAVVVWADPGADASHASLVAQRYDRGGKPLGSAIPVATAAVTEWESHGGVAFDVALEADGDFILAWQTGDPDQPSPGGPHEILARRFHADGSAAGGVIRVDDAAPGYSNADPSLALAPDGGFIVSWGRGREVSPGQYEVGVYARRFDAADAAAGPQFDVRGPTAPAGAYDTVPSVATDSAGNFVVTWLRNTAASDRGEVYARRFDAASTPRADEFRVDEAYAYFRGGPDVAVAPDGKFVIAYDWRGFGTDSMPRVAARPYDAAGAPVGGERIVADAANLTGEAHVGIAADGTFVVEWTDNQDLGRVLARWYDPAGVAAGDARQVDQSSLFPSFATRTATDVAVNPSGDAFFLWNTVVPLRPGRAASARRYVNEAPPAVSAAIPAVVAAEDSQPISINLRDYFADPDDPDEALTFSAGVTYNFGPVSTTVDGTTGVLTLGFIANRVGQALVWVQAVDPRGAAADTTFTVTVTPVPDPPVIGVLFATPNPLNVGARLFLTPADMIDPEGLTGAHVDFWRETNGIPGLQAAGDGTDTPVGSMPAPFQLSLPTAGLAPGEYVYWARAVDADGNAGDPVSVGHTVAGDRPGVPGVAGVYVGGDVSPTFLAALEAAGVGDRQYGYAVPGAAGQLATVPWRGFSLLRVRFTEPVRIDPQVAVRAYGVNQQSYLRSPVPLNYVRYDPSSMTAIFSLDAARYPIMSDKVLIVFKGDGDGAITDLAGNRLDGEWADGGHAFPSGDGTAGGDFRFRLNLLMGDADRNGQVNALDLAYVKRRLNRRASDGVVGPGSYSVFADVNCDLAINASDLAVVKQNLNTTLPKGEPSVPPPVAIAALDFALPAPDRLLASQVSSRATDGLL